MFASFQYLNIFIRYFFCVFPYRFSIFSIFLKLKKIKKKPTKKLREFLISFSCFSFTFSFYIPNTKLTTSFSFFVFKIFVFAKLLFLFHLIDFSSGEVFFFNQKKVQFIFLAFSSVYVCKVFEGKGEEEVGRKFSLHILREKTFMRFLWNCWSPVPEKFPFC